MPGWAPLTIWTHNLREAPSPAPRGRCFITSYSKQFLEVIGNVLPEKPLKHPAANLTDFLDDCSQEVDLETLGEMQRKHVKAWNDIFNDQCRNEFALGIVDLARRPTAKFNAYISQNFSPIFTTKNDKLLAMKTATAESAKTAGHGRVLTLKERAAMQGYLLSSFPAMSDRQVMNAMGETLPVNLAGVMLQPVMKAWATYESRLIESGLWGERRILGKTRCWRLRRVKTADVAAVLEGKDPDSVSFKDVFRLLENRLQLPDSFFDAEDQKMKVRKRVVKIIEHREKKKKRCYATVGSGG